jgi:hypothetical protein
VVLSLGGFTFFGDATKRITPVISLTSEHGNSQINITGL